MPARLHALASPRRTFVQIGKMGSPPWRSFARPASIAQVLVHIDHAIGTAGLRAAHVHDAPVPGDPARDDHRATEWLRTALANVAGWESIEHVVVEGAMCSLLAEHDLPEIERLLGEKMYACRFSLQEAYAQRWFQRQQAARAAQRTSCE